MFFINAFRARRHERRRERLLEQAYAERRERERQRQHRSSRRERQHDHYSHVRERSRRPETPPTNCRRGARHRDVYQNPFDTDSDEELPDWVHYPYGDADEIVYWENMPRSRRYRRGSRHRNSERAMPDLAVLYSPRWDSLPQSTERSNYHPRHGHRYLREDEHMPQAVLDYVAPLNYRRHDQAARQACEEEHPLYYEEHPLYYEEEHPLYYEEEHPIYYEW